MKSQKTNASALDTIEISNLILDEVIDADLIDYINKPLDTVDLVRIDNANMWMIQDTVDFSEAMLEEFGLARTEVKDLVVEPPKAKVISIEDKIGDIQKEVMADITAPLQNMFDDILVYVTKELA